MNNLIEKIKKAKLPDLVYGLLVLLVFVLPLSIPLASGVLGLALVTGGADRFLRRHEMRENVLPTKFQYLLWVLMFLGAASVTQCIHDYFFSGYNFVVVCGSYIVCYWLMINYGAEKERPLFLVKTFLASAALVAAYGFVQYKTGMLIMDNQWVDAAKFPELKARAVSTLQNPNILGSYLVMAASYCIGLFTVTKEKKTKIKLGVVFLLCCACLILTFSRGSWISLVMAIVLSSILFYRKLLWALLVLGVLVFIGAKDVIMHRILSIFQPGDTSAALRYAYVQCTWPMIMEHPWLGLGWGSYQLYFHYYDFFLLNKNETIYHAHNLFLNVAAEIGIPGFLAFMAVLAFTTVQAWRLAKTAVTPWIRGIGCGYVTSMIGTLVGGLTDHTLFNIQMGMLFWLFNALVLCCVYLEKKYKLAAK